MRRFVTIAVACAAFAVAAGSAAVALEEQRAPPAASEASPQSGVQDSAAPAKTEGGTEIRIPGLGKLGTLPKMDFGLELLYGAADGKSPDVQEPVESTSEDLTVRGSVKHRF